MLKSVYCKIIGCFILCRVCLTNIDLLLEIIGNEFNEVQFDDQGLKCRAVVFVVGLYVLTQLFVFNSSKISTEGKTWHSIRFKKIARLDDHYVEKRQKDHYTPIRARKPTCLSNLRLVVTTDKQIYRPEEIWYWEQANELLIGVIAAFRLMEETIRFRIFYPHIQAVG